MHIASLRHSWLELLRGVARPNGTFPLKDPSDPCIHSSSAHRAVRPFTVVALGSAAQLNIALHSQPLSNSLHRILVYDAKENASQMTEHFFFLDNYKIENAKQGE